MLCVVTVTLVYTRSLFHFSWALLLLLLVVIVGARHPVSGPAIYPRCLFVFVLAALVILGWPAKNYFIFGTFSFSSWQGLNFSQGLPIERGPWSQMFSFGTLPASVKRREAAIHSVPLRFRDIPVLAEPVKTKGVPNWNHYVMLEHSRTLGKRALEKLRREPAQALRKAAKNYSRSYTISTSRDPRSGEQVRRSESAVALWWQRAYEILVFQFFGENSASGRISGFAVIFPTVILLTGVKLIRTWNHNVVTSSASRLVYPHFELNYPFLGGDTWDWLSNGLAFAGYDVRYSARPPLLPLLLAFLERLSILGLFPIVLQAVVHATMLGLYRHLRGDYSRRIAFVVVVTIAFNFYWRSLSLDVMADVLATSLLMWSVFFWRRSGE